MHGFLHLSQTNSLIAKLTNIKFAKFYLNGATKMQYVVLMLITFLLSSCSTKPTITHTDTIEKKQENTSVAVQTAEQKLALAKSLNAQLVNDALSTAQQSEINSLLIEASELFLQEENFTKALWLAEQVSNFPQESLSNRYRLILIKASSLQALNFHQEAFHQLQLAKGLVTHAKNNEVDESLELTLPYYLVLTQVLESQQQNIAALEAQLKAFALNDQATTEDILNIWHKLEPLTSWEISQLVKSNPPFIHGWQSLLNYSHQFGANSEKFSRYLTLWQRNNPEHPAVNIVDYIQPQDSRNIATVKNIAVLLPLTGTQQNAGIAAQQGILAAYNNNTDIIVHFIDTNKLDWQTLALQFSQQSIDHVIGPLLKENVDTFLALSTEHEPLQVPTLLLNLTSSQPLANYQSALSMRPEDESIQAAATLSQHNFKHPIVLSHQDRVSRRSALAFSKQWLASTGNSVDIIYFNQGKELQTSLKDSLDVNASQTRIKHLNDRIKNTIKAEPRNRRDIDMIYVIGTATQTRLIKPYIDVNTSPFAKIIPVYASSRSHSNFYDSNNPNNANDLQGLTFTQIPWLLPSSLQNKNLAQLSDQLWPKRTDSLSRIFAMGFDSYHLLGKVSLMKENPYIRHFGQTGVLSLNNDNILTRSLIWGQYQHDKVVEIAMD